MISSCKRKFTADVIELVKEKGFFSYDFQHSFKKLNESLTIMNFIIQLLKVKLVMKIMDILLSFGKHLK